MPRFKHHELIKFSEQLLSTGGMQTHSPKKIRPFSPVRTLVAPRILVLGLISRTVLRHLGEDWIVQDIIRPLHDPVLLLSWWPDGKDIL